MPVYAQSSQLFLEMDQNNLMDNIINSIYQDSKQAMQMLSYIHIKPFPNIYKVCRKSLVPAHNLSVKALDGLVLLDGLDIDANAVLVTAGVDGASQPQAVATTERIGASLEADITIGTSSPHEVVLVCNLPGSALLVLANGLDTCGVSNHALTHTAAVDEGLVRRVVGVQVETTVLGVDAEGGVVDVGEEGLGAANGARAVLAGGADDEAAVLGLHVGILDGGAGADGHQAEDVVASGLGAEG
jgi:hypothetical protein